MDNNFNTFLQDLSYNASFRFLDMAGNKDKEKLLEVAKSTGLELPAHDLAVFECVYAYTDRQNKNGCTLPKGEVEKALKTLRGKSIDLDHQRKTVVGYWLDGKIDGDKIIAYGAFWKGSFQEDYDVIKELFDKGNLAVSFEAWGDRTFTNAAKTEYTLSNIEFAGGALLIKTEPAFDGAGVLEMAKTRVLELASHMKAPDSFVRGEKTKSDAELEQSRYYQWDMENISRSLAEVACPGCQEKGMCTLDMVDFKKNKANTTCWNCEAEMAVDLTPAVTLSKKGRKIKQMKEWSHTQSVGQLVDLLKDTSVSNEQIELSLEAAIKPGPRLNISSRFELSDDDFAIVMSEKDSKRKVRILPIHDLGHINLASAVIESDAAHQLLDKLSISKDIVDRKIARKVINIAMDKLMKKYNKSSAVEALQAYAKETIGRELTSAEVEKAYSVVAVKVNAKNSNSTSLMSLSGPANWSNQSLLSAALEEADYKEVIETATKVETKPATPAPELAELTAKLADATAKLTEATTKLAAFEAEKAAAAEARKAELLTARKAELTEAYITEQKLTDEDLLDETKYELAKLRKENADLKKGASKPAVNKVDLAKGAAKPVANETPEQASRRRIDERAWRSNQPVAE